jgi:hypothetical protein
MNYYDLFTIENSSPTSLRVEDSRVAAGNVLALAVQSITGNPVVDFKLTG